MIVLRVDEIRELLAVLLQAFELPKEKPDEPTFDRSRFSQALIYIVCHFAIFRLPAPPAIQGCAERAVPLSCFVLIGIRILAPQKSWHPINLLR